MEKIQVQKITRPEQQLKSLPDLIIDYDNWEKSSIRFEAKTSITGLDEIVTFSPGEFILLGARAGSGKTRFAINLINEFAIKRNIPLSCCYMATEDTQYNFVNRLLDFRTRGQLSLRKLNSKKLNEAEKLLQANEFSFWMQRAQIYYQSISGMTIEEIISHLNHAKQKGVQIFFIDYIQAINGTSKNIYERNTEISQALRNWTLSSNSLVIGVVQLNRDSDSSEQPSMKHIKGSGDYEQDATTIILLNRIYEGKKRTNDVSIFVAKNRNGGGMDGTFETNEYYEEKI